MYKTWRLFFLLSQHISWLVHYLLAMVESKRSFVYECSLKSKAMTYAALYGFFHGKLSIYPNITRTIIMRGKPGSHLKNKVLTMGNYGIKMST